MVLRRAAAALLTIGLLSLGATAHAAEIKVLASTALKSVLEQLRLQFEQSSGNKLNFSFGPAAVLKAQIDQGAATDVAVLTAALTNVLAKTGKLDPATRATIARAGLGVAVRAGAPKPDVSTTDALKRTLLNAKSIGFNGVGASRASIEAMINKLGIAEALKPKIKLLNVSAPVAVAKGDVDVGLGPVSEILPLAGVQLAGSLPAEVQSYLVFTAAVSSSSKNAEAAKALIQFLTAPSVAPVLKAKGMEPG
jgi:molybdate transport system substrate-binding protein